MNKDSHKVFTIHARNRSIVSELKSQATDNLVHLPAKLSLILLFPLNNNINFSVEVHYLAIILKSFIL